MFFNKKLSRVSVNIRTHEGPVFDSRQMEAVLAWSEKAISLFSGFFKSNSLNRPPSSKDNTPIYEGTLLDSRYQIQAFLGEGTFGKVAKCLDTQTSREVAIKIVKDEPFTIRQAQEEIKILKQLQTLDPDKCHLVRWNGSFVHQRLTCLKFELLDMSLFHYMRQRNVQSLPMDEIRPVLRQVNAALVHLQDLQIMHMDLKLDNIMIVDCKQKPLQVKIIDFGLACPTSSGVAGTTVQHLFYRAPEVMLGMNYSEEIDMWSLGAIAAELALGFPLFPGMNEYETMKFIVDLLGMPPDWQLNCGQKATEFFIKKKYKQTWRLKTPEELTTQTGHTFRDGRCCHSLTAIENILFFKPKNEWKDVLMFMDLLKKMLHLDKYGRIVPLIAQRHPFLAVGQQTDSNQDTTVNQDVSADVEEPNITQQPSFKNVTPQEENVEDEEDEAALAQPEATFEISQGINFSSLTFNVEEPNITQELSFENVTPQEENVEDKEDEAALAQPEVVVKISQGINFSNLTFNVEEPNITQQPSLQMESVASKAPTPHEVTVLPYPENIEDEVEVENEEDKPAPSQLEVEVKTKKKRGGRIRKFFKRMRKVMSSWFHTDSVSQ